MLSLASFSTSKKTLNIKEIGLILPKMLTGTQVQIEDNRESLRELKDGIAGMSDPVDVADMNSLHAEIDGNIKKLVADTKLIRNAMDLVETGDYGYCETCGYDIKIERLNAYPTSSKCVDCQTLQEIKDKQRRTH